VFYSRPEETISDLLRQGLEQTSEIQKRAFALAAQQSAEASRILKTACQAIPGAGFMFDLADQTGKALGKPE
jgi:hypothetical protein